MSNAANTTATADHTITEMVVRSIASAWGCKVIVTSRIGSHFRFVMTNADESKVSSMCANDNEVIMGGRGVMAGNGIAQSMRLICGDMASA